MACFLSIFNNSSKILIVFLCLFLVKLNGGRHVQGILRGFDPFMNLVVDDSIEMAPGGQMNTIGMVVSITTDCYQTQTQCLVPETQFSYHVRCYMTMRCYIYSIILYFINCCYRQNNRLHFSP